MLEISYATMYMYTTANIFIWFISLGIVMETRVLSPAEVTSSTVWYEMERDWQALLFVPSQNFVSVIYPILIDLKPIYIFMIFGWFCSRLSALVCIHIIKQQISVVFCQSCHLSSSSRIWHLYYCYRYDILFIILSVQKYVYWVSSLRMVHAQWYHMSLRSTNLDNCLT